MLARIMRLVLQLEAPACYKLVVSVPAFLSAPCRCLPTRPDGPGESLVHRATVPGVPVERIRQPWARADRRHRTWQPQAEEPARCRLLGRYRPAPPQRGRGAAWPGSGVRVRVALGFSRWLLVCATVLSLAAPSRIEVNKGMESGREAHVPLHSLVHDPSRFKLVRYPPGRAGASLAS